MIASNLIATRAGNTCAADLLDVKSPCVSICKMDSRTELCSGCLRTLEEISGWGFMDAAERRAVWARLAQRAEAAL